MKTWGLLSLRIARWGQQSVNLSAGPVRLYVDAHEASPGCPRILINLCVEGSWGLLGSHLISTTKGSSCGARGDIKYLITVMAKELT